MSIEALVLIIMSTEISLIITDIFKIFDPCVSWFRTYRYSSSLLLSGSEVTWLTCGCCLCCRGGTFVRHILAKWFCLSHLQHVWTWFCIVWLCQSTLSTCLGVDFLICLSAFDCCFWETRLASSVRSFLSIPLASISLASKLHAFTIKLSRVSASFCNTYHHNCLKRQFWMTTEFISFATLQNLQVTASFCNLMTNWPTFSPGCRTAWQNWNTW